MITITKEQMNAFHKIERVLYGLLVFSLWRDPAESMNVMTLWIWLETVGFGCIVNKMLCLPLTLINELAIEAGVCLAVIKNDSPFVPNENLDIPLLQSLLEKDISLQFFLQYKLQAIQGMSRAMNEVCMRALSDIMQLAIRHRTSQSSPQPCNVQQPLQSNQNQSIASDNRTMFVTFSKGYPVLEGEVRNFFQTIYGDCIESLHMQEVLPPNQQSLFARIIFRSPSTIERILNGRHTVKFSIQGRHVWARKFMPKRPSSLSVAAEG
ncbi:hypothetical protein ACFE04_002969 [Oxalis oulophora]